MLRGSPRSPSVRGAARGALDSAHRPRAERPPMSAVARSTVAALLGPDILAALARIDGEPIDADTITGLPAARTDRATFRIVLQDGRVVKARRMRRARQAERFTRIIRAL